MPYKDKQKRRDYTRQWDRKYYHEHIEEERAKARKIRANDPKKASTRVATWREKNRHKSRECTRRWSQKNKGRRAANEAVRRARKLQATPQWLTKEQLEEIKQFYINCPDGFEVDHIHPLKGGGLSGLHVPWNLQYLSKSENRAKYNFLPVEYK